LPVTARFLRQVTAGEHVVNDTVGLRLFGGHETVTIDVVLNRLERLSRVVPDDLGHALTQCEHLARVDLDVRRRSREACGTLVDHDLGVGQRVALPLGPTEQQDRAHRHRHAHTDGGDVGLDVLHRVVDRHAGVDHPAG
jgi:hypothetical protein